MYKCNDCGNKFHEYEMKKVEESRGEFWGMPCYETIYLCPYCCSEDFDEYKEKEYTDDGESE